MNKTEFLKQLRNRLSGLPEDEIEERITFYSEMIDDRIEEGLSEEDAVLVTGSVEDIIAQASETKPKKDTKKQQKSAKRLKVWEIILLAVGSPVWLSLLIAAFAVIFSLYVSLWSVVVSLWVAFVSVAASAAGTLIGSGAMVFTGNHLSGIVLLGSCFFLSGISIFLFYGCRGATRGTLILTKNILRFIKHRVVKKEEV